MVLFKDCLSPKLKIAEQKGIIQMQDSDPGLTYDEKTYFTLSEPEICALRVACKTQEDSLKSAVEIVSIEEVEQEVEILENTAQISFQKHKAADVVFSLIAKAELEEFKTCHKDEERLFCGHTVKEHKDALELVLGQCGKFFSIN